MRVGIVGASGYTGLELVKILLSHPEFRIVYVANSEGQTTLNALHPALKDIIEREVAKADVEEIAKQCDLVFLALPHKHSMAYAGDLLERGVKVVDLSADYRLEQETYEQHYCAHEDPDHLEDAVYGLPELYRDEIKTADLVANPGCYPTASLLALMPFAKFLKNSSTVFIDARSGVSGAGKKCGPNTQFVSVNENSYSYAPMSHRHGPEIEEKLRLSFDKQCNVCFVPSLIPVTRGMLANVYFETEEVFDPASVLEEFYAGEGFVRVYAEPVQTKQCAGSNFCDIFAMRKENGVLVSAAIDNLMRGASSQAVVNANLMCGFDENLAIPVIPSVP